MNNLNFHKAKEHFEALKSLLDKGTSLGIDSSQLISKIDNIIRVMDDKVVRIVLLGSFSDGKTSAIAGLLGELKENMKIDQDESSDDLAIYHFDGLKNVEIIDTPGLFGTKEKEVDGENIKYSEITERYISEANIVIYVCDAVTPLKESHVEILKKVLRDFGKLQSTIFVINKMDEAGFDMLDEADYNRGSEIKKNVLISRLKDTISLTEEEARHLHIVCISADPKGKGLAHWFSKMDSYMERSHIGLLNDSISEIVSSSDIEQLKSDTNLAVITDVVSDAQNQLCEITEPVEVAINEAQVLNADLVQDQSSLKRDLLSSKARLLNELQLMSEGIKEDIDQADMSSINGIIENKLGIVDGQIDYNIINSRISLVLSQCVETNNYTLRSRVKEFSRKMDVQSKVVKDALKFGADKLGKVNITNTQVLNVRNQLGQYFNWAKKIKFKPHGAVKTASKMSKAAGIIGIVLNVGMDVGSYIKETKDLKKLADLKNILKSDISATFKDLYDTMSNDQSYFENFAPSYIQLCNAVEERNSELLKLQSQINLLRQYNEQINEWLINSRKQIS
jgi:predicted GTPase